MGQQDWAKTEIRNTKLPGHPAAQLVWLTDEKSGLRVGIVPADGGEVSSFQVKLDGKWREILYRALDYRSTPPDGWDGRAPLLWPAAGSVVSQKELAGKKKSGKDEDCAVRGHGFARHMVWQLENYGYGVQNSYATCVLASTNETRKAYPYDFIVSATYTLGGGELVMRYEVLAGAENKQPMPFNIGNHISFRLPFLDKGRFEECTLRTPAGKRHEINRFNLVGEGETPIKLSRPVPLADPALRDAILGGYKRRGLWMEIADPASGLTMRVTQAEIAQEKKFYCAEEDLLFVLWGDPKYNYFCPEPWLGRPNAVATRQHGVLLPPGKRFVWEMRLMPKA